MTKRMYIRVYSFDPMTWKDGIGHAVMSTSIQTIQHHEKFSQYKDHLHQTFKANYQILYLDGELMVTEEVTDDDKP